jgi:hypothetical protein
VRPRLGASRLKPIAGLMADPITGGRNDDYRCFHMRAGMMLTLC